MRLVITRFRDANSDWFVAEKDERLSALVHQPMPETNAGGLLTTWPTRREACAYAQVVFRLLADFPERNLVEVRERARQIVRHG